VKDRDEVKKTNRALYKAFETLQLDQMERVWAHDGSVTCIHPGWPIAEGWPAVRETWAVIFENTDTMKFRITDEHIEIVGDLAWVVCIEHVRSGDASGLVLATNVLRRGKEGWKIVHHHGSPVPNQGDDDEEEDDGPPPTVN
jgi:ketosteroid isomerase-like protein